MYSPYDWTQSVQHRRDYVQDRLRVGSPVVGVSFPGGVLLVTVRRGQAKIFDIYERLMFSALGAQSDVESIRLAAVDFAHREGFSRSPDDVTAHRVVGVALSPACKRAFGDVFANPFVIRCLFAELGAAPERDVFYRLA